MKANIVKVNEVPPKSFLEIFMERMYNIEIIVKEFNHNDIEDTLENAIRQNIFSNDIDITRKEGVVISGKTSPIFGRNFCMTLTYFPKFDKADLGIYAPGSIIRGIMEYLSKEIKFDKTYEEAMKKLLDYPIILPYDNSIERSMY